MFFAFSFHRHVSSDTFYSSSRVPSLIHISLVPIDSPTRWVNSWPRRPHVQGAARHFRTANPPLLTPPPHPLLPSPTDA